MKDYKTGKITKEDLQSVLEKLIALKNQLTVITHKAHKENESGMDIYLLELWKQIKTEAEEVLWIYNNYEVITEGDK